MPKYIEIEDNLHSLIAAKFGLTMEDFNAIKVYDKIALVLEARAFMAPFHPDWTFDESCMGEAISCYENAHNFYKQPWTPKQAEQIYLNTFTELWVDRIY